jgi:hypothetical protein
MTPGPQAPTLDIWRTARKFPRVSITIPVEVSVEGQKKVTNTLNLGIGGMLLQPEEHPLAVGTEVQVLFNLPTGHSISTAAKVAHAIGAARGLQFRELEETSRIVLSRFLRRMLNYVRRGVRLTRRLYITIRASTAPESAFEMAETIAISRHGGLLSTRGHFNVGDEVRIWWPDGKRGTTARIVHRRASGLAGLLELGFEFHQDINFWGLDFPEETRE